MNKKHYLILGVICLILFVGCVIMSIMTQNDLDPLNISFGQETKTQNRADIIFNDSRFGYGELK